MEERKELQEKNLFTMVQLTQKYFLRVIGNDDRSLLISAVQLYHQCTTTSFINASEFSNCSNKTILLYSCIARYSLTSSAYNIIVQGEQTVG
jgi:hypothetical protein